MPEPAQNAVQFTHSFCGRAFFLIFCAVTDARFYPMADEGQSEGSLAIGKSFGDDNGVSNSMTQLSGH